MTGIKLDKDSRSAAASALQTYLKSELDVEISGFDVEFLLDFVTTKLGPYYYNQGLRDAQAIMLKKLELIAEAVDEIQQPVRI